MTAENPPRSGPLPEDVALPDENDDESLIDGNSIRGQEAPEIQENVIKNKGLGKGTVKKRHGMMALPSEIRETILYLTDPETFASLVLVDHAWRSASQTPHLYAHHLSRCPSFSRSHNVVSGSFTDDSIP
ncbi:hypothetical protein ABVK25_003877 [Lepraria finkii]|uniref:F-box domain-containing protein n=1 Tax=Lepraria finkii TaxID=1340010 RepID=A0ABR4BDD5_9LECA